MLHKKALQKNRTISSFFLLKIPSGPVTVYQELYPKNYILRHQFESKKKVMKARKKSISSKLIKMNYDYDTICTFRVPIFRIIFADTYYIIILVKLAN